MISRTRHAEREPFVTKDGSMVREPGTPHAVRNTGTAPLAILCRSSPAYAHGDTDLLE